MSLRKVTEEEAEARGGGGERRRRRAEAEASGGETCIVNCQIQNRHPNLVFPVRQQIKKNKKILITTTNRYDDWAEIIVAQQISAI